MTDNVSIPADVAKAVSAFIRSIPGDVLVPRADRDRWADLLDPRPLSLYDEVCAECIESGMPAGWAEIAAMIAPAVVKARIDALPQIGIGYGSGQKFAHRCSDIDALFAEVTP